MEDNLPPVLPASSELSYYQQQLNHSIIMDMKITMTDDR